MARFLAMMDNHIQNLLLNLKEVKRLLEIHTEVAGSAVGRKHQVEVLNKSGIVLLSACWEAFVEDMASSAFDFMLSKASDHNSFPTNVLTLASNNLKKANDDRRVWELAGSGWRTVLQNHKAEVLDKYVGKLNTPRADNIDKMYEQLIGVPKLSDSWTWRGTSPVQSRQRLSDLVTLRGSIAHRVSTGASVRKSIVIQNTEFIQRLAVISSNTVALFVNDTVGEFPWVRYSFRRPN